jgi:hypothetical protein
MNPSADATVDTDVSDAGVRVGYCSDADTETAVHGVLDDLQAEASTLSLVFFSPDHDEDVVRKVLDGRVGANAVAGSTAGEISTEGFSQGTIVGLSLHGPDVRAAVDIVPNLDELSLVPLVHLPEQFARRIGRDRSQLDPDRHVWLFLVDGLSKSEDLLTPFFMQASPDINLVGGSLSDGNAYEQTHLAHFGRLYDNAAAIALLEYNRPFSVIHGNHMKFTDRWLEVTSVSSGGRCLERINGHSAVHAYADALGVTRDDVTTDLTAIHPLGFRFRGRPFVCSIIEPTDQGALRLANPVHSGERLNVLEPTDLVEHTRATLADAVAQLGLPAGDSPQGMLLFNCIARYREARQNGTLAALGDVFAQYPVAGFNSLGEQHGAMHTNHSLTGIAFG